MGKGESCFLRILSFQEDKNGHAKAVSEVRDINELNKT